MVTDHIILSLKRQIDDSSFLSQESGVSHFIITKKRSWDRAKQWSQCKCSDFDGDSPFPQRQISQPGVNCLRKEYTWLWNPNRRSIKNPPSGFSQLPVALAPPKREKKNLFSCLWLIIIEEASICLFSHFALLQINEEKEEEEGTLWTHYCIQNTCNQSLLLFIISRVEMRANFSTDISIERC